MTLLEPGTYQSCNGKPARVSFNGGYWVASKATPEHAIRLDCNAGLLEELESKLIPDLLADVTKLNNVIHTPRYGVGIWNSDTIRFYDISEHVEDLETALELGRAREQIAIWDIAAGKEIRLT